MANQSQSRGANRIDYRCQNDVAGNSGASAETSLFSATSPKRSSRISRIAGFRRRWDNEDTMNAEIESMIASSKKQPQQLLRFHLRHLFLAVTLVSILCAIMVSSEGAWALVLGCAVLLVGAHVMGNLIGTRLRNSAAEVDAWNRSQSGQRFGGPRVTEKPLTDVQPLLPPSTPLATKQKVAHWTRWFVAGGTCLGLVLGTYAIYVTLGTDAGWAGWLVGVLSSGVLGAWVAFLICTFNSIARHAWRHADRNGELDTSLSQLPVADAEPAQV